MQPKFHANIRPLRRATLLRNNVNIINHNHMRHFLFHSANAIDQMNWFYETRADYRVLNINTMTTKRSKLCIQFTIGLQFFQTDSCSVQVVD